jgi:predicted Fe-Mo cluster-binding NifX family protein
MKIILTAVSPTFDSPVDRRFGRCVYFILYDTETLEWQAHQNPGVGASGGAGTLAAQFVANQHAYVVISGDFGPNAYDALEPAGIEMYLFGNSDTVKEAIERYSAGNLERVGAPTSQGHHWHG